MSCHKNPNEFRWEEWGGTIGDLALELSDADGNGRSHLVCVVIRNPKDIGWKKRGGDHWGPGARAVGYKWDEGDQFVLSKEP